MHHPLPRSEIPPRSPICTRHSLPCLDITRLPMEIAKQTAPGTQNRVPGPLPGSTPSHFESQARGIAPVPYSSCTTPSLFTRHQNGPKKRPRARRIAYPAPSPDEHPPTSKRRRGALSPCHFPLSYTLRQPLTAEARKKKATSTQNCIPATSPTYPPTNIYT